MHLRPTPCATAAAVFQHPFVEDPTSVRAGDHRREAQRLVDEAAKVCTGCAAFEGCLYEAVVEHEVAGVVAGTTQVQRSRIRRLLGVRLETEDLGSYAGTAREGSRLSHTEVIRLRNAHPDVSLETIAEWLDCSLSTVKRHLRRARREAQPVVSAPPRRPSPEAVLKAHAVVTGCMIREQVA